MERNGRQQRGPGWRAVLAIGAVAVLSCQLLAADSLNVRSVGVWSYGPCRAASGGWIGGHRYAVASSGQRLQVHNIDAPTLPQIVSDLTMAGDIFRIWVDGDRAYVAYDRTGLAIVDLANPSRPVLLGTAATADRVCGVSRTGQVLALAGRSAGLVLVNIADPSRPAVAGQCPLPGPAMDVAIDGNRAYVACGSAGLRAVNIAAPTSPYEVGHCGLEGTATGIDIGGRHAYLACGSGGLAVVNIDSMALTVRCPINRTVVNQSQLYRDFVMMADSAGGIRVVEVQDLTDIGQACYYHVPYPACQLTVLDSLALVADSLAGLRILDLAALHHWTADNVWVGGDTAFAVSQSSDSSYSYVAAGSDGLRIYSISDPAHPSEVGNFIPGGRVYQLAKIDTFSSSMNYPWPLAERLYCIAAGDSGLIAVDLSNPAMPVERSRIHTPGPAYDVSMTAYTKPLPDTVFIGHDTITMDTVRLAAVACGDSNVWYYHLSAGGILSPWGPVKRQHPVFAVSVNYGKTLFCSGGDVLAEECGIRSIDTTYQFLTWGINFTGGNVGRHATERYKITPVGDTLVFWTMVSWQSGKKIMLPGTVEGGDIQDTTYSVCDGKQGAHQFTYNDIGYGHCVTPGVCMDVTAIDSIALVADGPAGLQVVDMSRPNKIRELGAQRMALSSCAVAGIARHAYMTGPDTTLWTLDLSDSSRPVARGMTRLPRPAFGLAARESLLLVADGDSGLQVCSLADPGQPAILGRTGLPGYALAVASQGMLAAVAADSGGLSLVDLGDPRHPVLLGRYDTPGTALGVALDSARQLAVVADGLAGVEVIDISDPAAPALLGSYDTEGLAFDVALRGTQAAVADGTSGLVVLDLSDAAHPAKLGSLRTGGCARQLAARDSVVYLADGEGGLSVINIAEPGQPAEVGNYRPGRPVWAVARYGDCLLALDDAAALRVLWPYWTARQPYVGPGAVALRFENRPNPFGDRTAVMYQLTEPGAVSVALYNIQGQQVKVLVSGVQGAGSYQVEWDGKGSDGRMLASGVYLCRLSANGRERYHKVVLLR